MKKILKYINLLMVVILLASCSEDYLDVNTDPNNPTAVSPDLILPVAQVYTANLIYSGRRLNDLGNLMMYNWSQSDGFSWYTDEFKYNVTSTFYQGIFNDSYTNALKQYNIITQLDTSYNNYIAIGKIMKAYHYQILVDLYGDVPYSEALQRGALATPKYDDAQTIYENLIVELTEAIELINNAEANLNAVVPGDDDIMFQGHMDVWKQFANSVKLRILVRQMSMSGRSTYIQTEMNAIVAEGSGFITDNAAVNPGYLNEENKLNPLWANMGKDASGTVTMNNNATCATDYILAYLTATNDPRIDYLYEKPATGHLGVKQGLLDYDFPVPDQYMPEFVSNIGPGILKGFDMDAIVYSLAECYFNQAEAVLNNYLVGDVQTLYQLGIEASFVTLGLTTEAASLYYSQPLNLVNYSLSTNQLQAIITQKWIALNGTTAEQAWFEYNRTGYPANLPISLQASTADRPVRLYYPSGEYSSNGANVPTQPNAFSAKIFWGL